MVCKESGFTVLNSCVILKEHFPCTQCAESIGADLPCYVEKGAPPEKVRLKFLALGGVWGRGLLPCLPGRPLYDAGR